MDEQQKELTVFCILCDVCAVCTEEDAAITGRARGVSKKREPCCDRRAALFY